MISDFTRPTILATACAASMVTLIANANAQNKFDGTWSVVLATNSGPCEQTYSGRVQIINGVVHFSGGGLSGRVTERGAVSVTASMGEGWGVGSGQLSTNSGHGTWRSQVNYRTCSGTWNTQKE
jgi:hypothetical protein